MQVAMGSGRYFGGGLSVTDTAEATDGYLNIHVITAPNVRSLLWTLRHLRSGRYAPGDSALRVRARRVRVETRRRHRINVDGELHGHTPLEVQVRPRGLPVYVPPSREGRRGRSPRPLRDSGSLPDCPPAARPETSTDDREHKEKERGR
jgi:diacylglycerol kinase family enzyme